MGSRTYTASRSHLCQGRLDELAAQHTRTGTLPPQVQNMLRACRCAAELSSTYALSASWASSFLSTCRRLAAGVDMLGGWAYTKHNQAPSETLEHARTIGFPPQSAHGLT